jgi:predicted permease
MTELFRRLRHLLNRRRFDRELENDMQFHREMAAKAGGAPFGSVLRLREDSRDAWGWTWIDRLGQDLRYGLRMMAQSPGFTFMAVMVLAIGIGVNVAAFTLFDMVALRPLPVRDADRLVRMERKSPSAYTSEASYPSFLFYRDHAKSLAAGIAVLGAPPMQIGNDIAGSSMSFVTPNYFTELGVRAAYGRTFDPTLDGSEGSPPVMVISYELWQRRFAGDPGVIGRSVTLNKKPVAIVGVTPYALATLGGQHPDLWLPIAQQPYMVDNSQVLHDFDKSMVRMWGKLAPGVTARAAGEELRSLTNQLRRQHPNAVWDHEFIQLSPGGHLQVMQPVMYQVAAMVGLLTLLILAVACSNLGALLLARAVEREREFGIRLAIGASGARVFRQLCTESLLLAGLGAGAGLALGCLVIRIVLATTDAPRWLSAVPDARILLFTIAMSVLSTVLFGLAPAFQVARQGQRKTRARQILVTVQLAGSCLLLIVAGLLVRAAQHALFTDPGFGYERLITIDAQLDQHGYNAVRARMYLDQMQARLSATPGVRAVSLVSIPPLGHVVSYSDTQVDGHDVRIYPNWVAPGFFSTTQIPMLLGRSFVPNEKNVVIVSKSFARSQWPGQNPLGKLMGEGKDKNVVVGVVGDAHMNGLNDDDALEQYWPAGEEQIPDLVLIVRCAGAAEHLPLAAKAISESIDPKLFPEIRLVKALYNKNVRTIEQVAEVVTLIGLVAVVLAGVGVIGLVSFTVRQRKKEIAIRLALGSSGQNILKMVLLQFSWPVLIGLLMGTGAAAAGSKILRRALFGVSNLDPIAYAGAIGFLIAVLAVSALLPARRALRINVSRELHYQ